jgi:hypothetical protein
MNNKSAFGDYIVFVDETGDHGLANISKEFPLFGLAFCVVPKSEYIDRITPALRKLKFSTFGHDNVILHEHDIRKKQHAFSMMSQKPRAAFLARLSEIIQSADFSLITVIIDKRLLSPSQELQNPYHMALLFGLERVFRLLSQKNQNELLTHIVVESRGKREDVELELEFRRIVSGENVFNRVLPFELIMADKRTNSEGLQLADMVARPVALSVLRPEQTNRTAAILQKKFWKDSAGEVIEYGLKVYPPKSARATR